MSESIGQQFATPLDIHVDKCDVTQDVLWITLQQYRTCFTDNFDISCKHFLMTFSHILATVFCPGLKKGTVLLEVKGHFSARISF